MSRITTWLMLPAVAGLLIGCSSGSTFLPKKEKKAAASERIPASSATASQSPYVLNAGAMGPCISFTITNTSATDLPVAPEHFALIPKGTHRVVPYDTQSATVDVPSACPAGQTVSGRAIFKEFTNPVGSRLVFKPDGKGTFAVVSSSTPPQRPTLHPPTPEISNEN